MKKIFTGIGVLVALFSIYFFLLMADRMVYQNEGILYNFDLSESILLEKLEDLAKDTHVTIFLEDYNNICFGKTEMEITVINSDSSVRLGRRPSVFPKEKIIYKVFDRQKHKRTSYFTIQETDKRKIEKIQAALNKAGLSVELLSTDNPLRFTVMKLFSPLSISFFSLLSILLIMSIATYYVHRLKEIGVLKLSGWSNRKISCRLLWKVLSYLYLSSLSLIIPFGIYVVCKDNSKIGTYIKIYIILCLFLAVVCLYSVCMGSFFIYHVNRIGALKNQRNNKLIFYVLLTFKLVTTIIFVLSMNNMKENIDSLNGMIKGIEQFINYDMYKINQSAMVIDKHVDKKLQKMVESLSDDEVFNYGVGEALIDPAKLKDYQSKGKLRDSENYGLMIMSPNVLSMLNILDEKGEKILASKVKPNTLLVPIHYKGNIDEIMKKVCPQNDSKIVYIQNGQAHRDILFPDVYVYDFIYKISELKKVWSLNYGEVLLKKASAKKVMEKLDNLGVNGGNISVDPLTTDYYYSVSNLQLELCETVFRVVISAMSFLLCVVSITIIFLELRKKEFGVYKLIGRYPKKMVGIFIGMNGLITLGVAIIINPLFIFLLLVEGFIYGILLRQYMKNKAILALKGE